MRRLTAVSACAGCALFLQGTAQGQFRGAPDWTTDGGDAQRSSWVRNDPKISPETVAKKGQFDFLWKQKLGARSASQLGALTPALLLDRYIGYRGFRSYAFFGGSGDSVHTLDSDLGRVEWQTKLSKTASPVGTADCPGGMVSIARPSASPFQSSAGGRGGFGRSNAAKSGVGQADEGSVVLAEIAARTGGGGPGPFPPPQPPPAKGQRTVPAIPGPFSRQPMLLYALSGEGMLHSLYVSNGEASKPAQPFLPPNASAQGFTVVDHIAYAVTGRGCGGAADGIWAFDIASGKVNKWESKSPIAGTFGQSFGPDGTVYAATKGGEVIALDPVSLQVKGSYPAAAGFASSPVVFEHKQKTVVAVGARDGKIHLLDGGAAAISQSAPVSAAPDAIGGALASWQDRNGTRWLLAPVNGPVSGGAGVTNGAVVAWKAVDQDGVLTLTPGWVSRDLVSPLPPMVINGVAFVVSSGAYQAKDAAKMTAAQRAQKSSPAVLYALDAITGKELWNSGKTMTSFVHGAGLAGGGSQVYVQTSDGMMYVFGAPMEH